MSALQIKRWGHHANRALHLLMLLTFVDAIFLCAFYALISYSFAPFVLKQDASHLYYIYYSIIPIIGRFVMRSFIAKLIAHISFTLEGAIREELVLKLLKVGPLSYAVKSSLTTLFVDAVDDIMPYFSSFLVALRYAMVIPVVTLIAIASVSPFSGFILFCMAPLIPLFMLMIGKGAERLNQRQWAQITRLGARFHEVLDKIALVKLFNLERNEIEKIARLTKRWRVETMIVLKVAFLSALVLEFFATCGIALCAITLGFAVYEHGFDYTIALFVLLLAPEFFLPLRQLGLTYHSRMKAFGAMSGLVELLSEKDRFKLKDIQGLTLSEIAKKRELEQIQKDVKQEQLATLVNQTENEAKEQVHVLDNERGLKSSLASSNNYAWLKAPFTIELKNVSTTYPNGRVGLENFSGCFVCNEPVALVGSSGVGKSTLLHTIAGFARISSGEIVVNGHCCSLDDLMKLMQHITYIPQLPHLFYGTLRDNLKLGANEASDDELIKALELVGAKDIIQRFPLGLDHLVGDQNRGISGGETRLIALARAFLRKSDILLLDEPTASLDAETEKAFLQALKVIALNKTVIVVAHRSELIAFAQKVIEVKRSEQVANNDITDSDNATSTVDEPCETKKQDSSCHSS